MDVTMPLEITGLGIVFYSPHAVAHIKKGEDYLQAHFWEPADVAEHVNSCQIAAFGTGSPGQYILRLYDGPLDETAVEAAKAKGRLGLEVRRGQICFRDLYDFMEWEPECPPSQIVSVEDGFHRITVYTSPPDSGILGRHQTIWLHFEAWPDRPRLAWPGVPDLSGTEEDE